MLNMKRNIVAMVILILLVLPISALASPDKGKPGQENLSLVLADYRFVFINDQIVLLKKGALVSEGTPVIYKAGERALVRIGYRYTIEDGETRVYPIYVIQTGDTAEAQAAANYYWRDLGVYALNGIICVRYDEVIWKTITYRRPKNIDELFSWIENKERFKHVRWVSGNRLPEPFGKLDSEDLAKINYFIFYLDDGGTAYLKIPINPEDAKSVVQKLDDLDK